MTYIGDVMNLTENHVSEGGTDGIFTGDSLGLNRGIAETLNDIGVKVGESQGGDDAVISRDKYPQPPVGERLLKSPQMRDLAFPFNGKHDTILGQSSRSQSPLGFGQFLGRARVIQ